MDQLKEKVSYLKGLSDGLGISHETKEGKVLLAIIDLLDDMTEEIVTLNEVQEELDEYVEAIDQDLEQLEDEIYEDEDDEEDDCYDEEDEGYIEVECPNCHETILLDEDMFDDEDEILCPNCKEPLELEMECGCGCGHDHGHDHDHE